LSLQTELKRLFPPDTIRQAKRLEPGLVDALAVQEAAGALLRLKGQPAEQVALVNTMTPSTAAALCRWLADPSFWGLVSNVTTH
jgi:hypothetical protein